MWHVNVVCSDPGCDEEFELLVEELDEIDLAACICGHAVVTLAVATHEPVELELESPALIPA
jgi:hypothetical protein